MNLLPGVLDAARRGVSSAVHQRHVKRALRPLVHAIEDLSDGDVLERNAVLRGRHAGERCFLVLTGASLNDLDVRALDGQWTFGCGRLADPEEDWNFHYHPLGQQGIFRYSLPDGPKQVDLAFYMGVDRLWRLISPAYQQQRKISLYRAADRVFRDPDCVFFCDAADRRFLRRHRLFEGRHVHYVRSAGAMLEAKTHTHDLTRRITLRDGSIFAMIAAAIHMGFSELYLCGAGYTYWPQDIFHYYAEPVFPRDWSAARRQAVIDAIRKDSGTEIMHVREDGELLRPRWVRYHEPDVRHRIMNDHAAAAGVRIYNVVPDGFESRVYTPVSWDEVQRRIGQSAPPRAAAGDRGDRRPRMASGGLA